mmetsp:Transcript_45741/g.138668  ORF Transcript_45741/g.138668 Transcript_45741/m.138668 type:complete len:216 (+) Transcript_45741:319-966(+)
MLPHAIKKSKTGIALILCCLPSASSALAPLSRQETFRKQYNASWKSSRLRPPLQRTFSAKTDCKKPSGRPAAPVTAHSCRRGYVRPPTTVPQTPMLRKSTPGSSGSASSTVKSANLPASMEPMRWSMPRTCAASTVTILRAWCRVTRSSGAKTLPDWPRRSVAIHISLRGSGGATGTSVCTAVGMPRSTRLRNLDARWARSVPRCLSLISPRRWG